MGVRWDWIFLNITAVFQSWLRNSVSQIPLTCREFGCPVPIIALETQPTICAMVSAHLRTFSLSWWVDGHRQKHHCNWQQFIDSQGENLACCLASLVQTEIISKTDQKPCLFLFHLNKTAASFQGQPAFSWPLLAYRYCLTQRSNAHLQRDSHIPVLNSGKNSEESQSVYCSFLYIPLKKVTCSACVSLSEIRTQVQEQRDVVFFYSVQSQLIRFVNFK